jgi:hypothetical protein
MGRTSFQNILALPDAAQSWNFDLFVPRLPGGVIEAQNLTYRCKTTELPGSTIEPVAIELHGVKKVEAGRAQYSHTFTAAFMETVDWATYLAFRGWRDSMRSWKNNSGTDSSSYKVNLELDLYDNKPEIARTIILGGCWPTGITQVPLNGAESAAVELTIEFSFDYMDDGISF